MLMTWFWLLTSLAIILVGCDLFTNGVEWAGKKLKLSEGAVGSVLAAVGTCLPETPIAILAIFLGRAAGADESIGIGAILGAPMMLATLAFFVTGAAVLVFSRSGKRPRDMQANYAVLGRDLRFFFIVFGLAAAASFLPHPLLKTLAAFLLLAFYFVYIRQTFSDAGPAESDEEISPLHFSRKHPDPPLSMVVSQAVSGLVVLVLGAHLFVGNLAEIAHTLGAHPLVLSLLLTPIATELPEKFNSVLWVRRGKDTLALGNISGAMVFQSSVPPAIGLLFTSWDLTTQPQAIVAVGVALASTGVVAVEMRVRQRVSAWSLLLGGGFYLAYVLWVLGQVRR